MKYEVTIGETTREIEVERGSVAGEFRISLDGGAWRTVDMRKVDRHSRNMLIEGLSYDAGVLRRDDRWDVDLYGSNHAVYVVDPKRKALKLSGGSEQGVLSTAMPGRVVRLLVKEGDAVTKGQPMIVVEAMKMENEMKAAVSGTVAAVMVSEGQALEAGAALIRVEAE